MIEQLPLELFRYLLHFLDVPTLAELCSVSSSFYALVTAEYGNILRGLGYCETSTSLVQSLWSNSDKLRFSMRVQNNYERWTLRSTPLDGAGREWSRSCMSILYAWPQGKERNRIVLAKGIELEIWEIDRFGRSWDLLRVNGGLDKTGAIILAGEDVKCKGYDDITGITSKDENELIVSRVSGRIQRIRFTPPKDGHPARVIESARYESTEGTIQSLSSFNDLVVAASSTRPTSSPASLSTSIPARHSLSIYSIASPWINPQTLSLATKCWSTLLTKSSLVLGSSGLSPLKIYPISPDGSTHPPTEYSTSSQSSTSIYALSVPLDVTPSQYFRSDYIIFAGCYDSITRVYDTRIDTKVEVMRLFDPLSDDASYSISSPNGPTHSYLAVGTARNASIRLFDLRSAVGPLLRNVAEDRGDKSSTTNGSTLFGKRAERSPVYGIVLEYSRIYAVTDRRGFVIDFDPMRGTNNSAAVGYYRHLGEGAGEFRKSDGASW
jgi:hypothetical protein